MKEIFDKVSYSISKELTKNYSTSFSLGIRFLAKSVRDPIYAIYGFVRLADEIVDSFHDYDKNELFNRFKEDLQFAMENKISLNPLLNSFQEVAHKYHIEDEMVNQFLYSMEMDLQKKAYDRNSFNLYVLGSAEVVGLMCLKVFCNGNDKEYSRLKPYGKKLGAAYQKINFLRDMGADFTLMGRSYFPGIDLNEFNEKNKALIEKEIDDDFSMGMKGILMLPSSAALGVYLSYVYYYSLFKKIRSLPAEKILSKRIRISNTKKYFLLIRSYMHFRLSPGFMQKQNEEEELHELSEIKQYD